MNNQRTTTKLQMMLKREGVAIRGTYRCDLCGKMFRSLQMHERINRYSTMGNEKARQLSFAAPLCNLLCQSCHEIADRKTNVVLLKAASVWMYGEEAVAKAEQEVQEAMKTR